MEYEYVTENNLEHRQYYNYAKFRGEEFLTDYFVSRQNAIQGMNLQVNLSEALSALAQEIYCESCEGSKDIIILKKELGYLLDEFVNDRGSIENKSTLDRIVKTFEVRKRFYHIYNAAYKPIDENDYNDLELYLMAAVAMVIAYQKYNDLKYLSALLKLNDILISRKDALLLENQKPFLELFWYAITEEVYYTNELLNKKTIVGE